MVGRLAPGTGRDERAVDLRLALADRAMVVGEFDLVERTLLEALDLSAGDEQRTAFARTVLAHRDYNVRNMHRGSALAEQALAAAERLGPGAGIIEARAAFVSGAIRMTRGEHPAAIAHFHHAISASGADPSTMVTIGLGLCHVAGRAWLGNSLAELGRFDEAIPLAREAVDRADAARNIFSMAWARAFLGRVQLARGDLDPSMAALVESQEMIDRYEIGLIGRLSVILLAHAHVLAGDARTALELARRGPRIWPTALLAEGESLLAAGSLAEAEAAVAQGLSVARAEGERGNESTALGFLGEIHERRGALARAREFYGEALAIATALGLRPREAHHRRGLGRVLARVGERDEARAQLSAALTLYGDMGMTRWIEPTRSELLAVAPAGVSESR